MGEQPSENEINWHDLIKEGLDASELASNICYIFKLQSNKQITLSTSDIQNITNLCPKAVDDDLLTFLNDIGGKSQLLTLVSNYITDLNSLAQIVSDPSQLNNIKLEAIIVQKMKSKLELRGEIINDPGWINGGELLDKICKLYPTLASFRFLSYDELQSKCGFNGDKTTRSQRNILEKIWMNGNDLRMAMDKYNLPLIITKDLEEKGVRALDQLSRDHVATLINDNHRKTKENSSRMANKDKGLARDEDLKFKAKLNHLYKIESKNGKTENIKRNDDLQERKIRTDEAIKSVNEIGTKLKDNASHSTAQVKQSLDSVAQKLNVNWKYSEDELKNPDVLLDTILKDLKIVQETYNSASCLPDKSDEDIIAHVGGGAALYGIQLTDLSHLGKEATLPMLRRPLCCELTNPKKTFIDQTRKFTSLNASNEFRKTIETGGWTLAVEVSASGWGASGSASYSNSETTTTDHTKQNKKQSTDLILTQYSFVPMKSFRIPLEEMKLSIEAEEALMGVTNVPTAKEFLSKFNSHISNALQTVGGIFRSTITVHTEEETDLEQLQEIASKSQKASAKAGYSGFGCSVSVAVSHETFNVKGSTTNSEKIERTATISTDTECWGPACKNSELFKVTLQANNSTWYLIDRNELSTFVPIWIIVERSYTEPTLIAAAEKIKQEWMRQAKKNAHIPIIQLEIQRVLVHEDCNPKDEDWTVPPLQGGDMKRLDLDGKVAMIDDAISEILGKNLDLNKMATSALIRNIGVIFRTVVNESEQYGSSLLPVLLQPKSSLTSFLMALARLSDSVKINHVSSLLATIFTKEKLQQFKSEYHLQLHPEIDTLILKGINANDGKTKFEVGNQIQFNSLFNTSTIPLQQLPSFLKSLMEEQITNDIFKLGDFNLHVTALISKSLENSTELADKGGLQDIGLLHVQQTKNLLQKYGWLHSHDAFVMELSQQGLETLFDNMNIILTKKNTGPLQTPVGIPDSITPSVSFSNITKNDYIIKYHYTDWLVDRPLPTTNTPIVRFMDELRHRLKITSSLITESRSIEATTQRSGGLSSTWTKSKEKQASYATIPSSYSVYNTLIHLVNHSDISSQIELFRLIIERRSAVPILVPNLDRLFLTDELPFQYNIDALSFVNTKLAQQRDFNLAYDCSLIRIAIISMRSIQHSESSEWMKQIFSCYSISLLSLSAINCIINDQCIGEIGVGFIPNIGHNQNDTKVYKDEKNQAVLLLHVIGDYKSLWPFIRNFADIIMVEEDPTHDVRFQPILPLHDDCALITWKVSLAQFGYEEIDENNFHFYGSVNQTVQDIRELLSGAHIKYQGKSRKELYSINNAELYKRNSIDLINVETVVKSQNYAILRREELKLQKIFALEAENVTLYYKARNKAAEQQAIDYEIKKCRQNRIIEASSTETHLLIQCFIGILSHPDDSTRMLGIHQLITGMEKYSKDAMTKIIQQKDLAFNIYDKDQKNEEKKHAYFDAKRIYSSSIVGIEHLWRELCHLYATNTIKYATLPLLAAQHLIDGFTLELLDGDAGMLEPVWIKAVFGHVQKRLEELRKQADSNSTAEKPIRICVLSIIGCQSSGKSTLLNLMFGTRLRTSAGQCTRGVNMQLIRVENRKEKYDYILVLDTEGIRAPEYAGLQDSSWRDNRIATFAILPADVTIICVNSEDDSAAREVLPIVMLTHQQSELATSTSGHNNRLSTRIFFVYVRVDTNDTKKLVTPIQRMFIDLKDNLEKLTHQKNNNDNKTNGDSIGFRDFRSKDPNDPNSEIGDARSDIKFLGKLKMGDTPPDDLPNTEFGQSVIELNDYIYQRLVTETADGQWEARELKHFTDYLELIWSCILSADFGLTFKTVMERRLYEELDMYLAKQRSIVANLYSTIYEEIAEEIGKELSLSSPDQTDKCKSEIAKYKAKLKRDSNEITEKINQEVLEELKKNHYQQWHDHSKQNWKTFTTTRLEIYDSRIRELITNRLTYDSKLISCQKQIRADITKLFQDKTKENKHILKTEEEKKSEFNTIYKKIIHETEQSHPQINVEKSITEVYSQNKRVWQFHQVTSTNIQLISKDNNESYFDRFMKYIWPNRKDKKRKSTVDEEQFLRNLCSEIENLLQSITCYDDDITQQAILKTQNHIDTSHYVQDTLINRAHQLVYQLLIEKLTRIQHKWESQNSITVRLKNAKADLWKFYKNTDQGIVGAELLSSELATVLNKWWKVGYKTSLCKYIANDLQPESWVSNSVVLLAYADLELLELIEKRKITEMIERVTNCSSHYGLIVNKLIKSKLDKCFKGQRVLYDDKIKRELSTAVAETKAFEAPLCTDPDEIRQGSTEFFFSKLKEYLPLTFTDPLSALNVTDYTACDKETVEGWDNILKNMLTHLSSKEDLTFSDDEVTLMVELIRNLIITNNDSNAVKLRCSIPCPECGAPCKRSYGHMVLKGERHDCDHQPSGLSGNEWIHNLELLHESCSQNVAAFPQPYFIVDEVYYPYSNFSQFYTEWKQPISEPNANPQNRVREYIFYHYQQELCDYHKKGKKPCSNIPKTYNHSVTSMKAYAEMIRDA